MNSIFHPGRLLGRIPDRNWVISLAVLGALLRIVYLLQFRESPLWDLPLGPDVTEYNDRAREILSGIFTPEEPDIHAPLYSWFLAGCYAVFGGSIPLVRTFQLALNFAAWLGLYAILVRLVRFPRNAGRLFLGFAMLYAVPFFHQSQLVSESILLPLLSGALGFLYAAGQTESLRKRGIFHAAAGIFAGLAAITHPMTLAFAAVETVCFLVRKQPKAALCFAAGVTLLVLPVSIAASVSAQHPVLIQSNSSFNFWLGNNPEATGGCYLRPGPEWQRAHLQAEREAAANGVHPDRIWQKRAFDFWTGQPLQALGLTLKKAVLVWHPHELISGADPDYVLRSTSVILYGGVLTFPIFVLAFAGLWAARRWGLIHFYLLLLAMYTAQVLTVTSGRYRTAMIPAVLVFAAAGATGIDWKRRYYLPVVLLALSALLQFPIGDRGEAAGLYGDAALARGDLDQAVDLYSYAARKQQAPSRFENLLGSIAQQRGEFEKAVDHYRRAIRFAPDEPHGRMNLANLYSNIPEKRETAERLYLEAIEIDPTYALLRFNYGFFLQNRKRLSEAEAQYREAVRNVPRHAAAWNGLGVTALLSGRVDEAEKNFRNAVEFEPENGQYQGNLEIVQKIKNKKQNM